MAVDEPLGWPEQPAGGSAIDLDRPSIDITSVDLGGDVVMVTERDGTIVAVNDAFVRVTGYSRQEAIGASPRLLNSGLQPDEVYRDLWTTVLSGNIWSGQLVDRHRDGSLRTHRVTITPIRSADGQVSHMVAVQRDLAADRIHPGTSTGIGELHTDVNGRCTFVDREAARLLDAEPHEVYAGAWETRLPEEDVGAILESLTTAVGTGRRQRLDVRTVTGRWLHLEIMPMASSRRVGHGDPTTPDDVTTGTTMGTNWQLEDITHHMDTHARLARRDAVITALLGAIDRPVALLTSDGTVSATNPAWSRTEPAQHPALAAAPGDDLLSVLRIAAERGSEGAGRLARALSDKLHSRPLVSRLPDEVTLHPVQAEDGGMLIELDLATGGAPAT